MDKRNCILVVDDEYINIQVIVSVFKGTYDILTALNGREAVALLNEHTPDLILLDVMMPDINGFDVCKIIKANPALIDIPIIFLTAMDAHEGALQGFDSGGIDYLEKPVDLALLKLRVRNHMESKERNDLVKKQRDLLARQKEELQAVLARLKRLEGIILICSYCKKIRDDQDCWHQLERYISDHSEVLFSHGICPQCLKEVREQIKIIGDPE